MSFQNKGVKIKPDFDDQEKIRKLKSEIKEMELDHAITFGYEEKFRKKKRKKVIIFGLCGLFVLIIVVAALLIN